MPEVDLEGPSSEHGCFIFFVGLPSEHFFFPVVDVGLAEQKPEHAFVDVYSCCFSFEEEGKLEPNIIVVVAIALFAEPASYLDPIFHFEFLLAQLDDKDVFALVLDFVDYF